MSRQPVLLPLVRRAAEHTPRSAWRSNRSKHGRPPAPAKACGTALGSHFRGCHRPRPLGRRTTSENDGQWASWQQRRSAHPVCPRMASTLGIRRLGPGRERGDRARSIWAQSPGHDDSVAIVHAVQPQQIAVLSGPQARLEIATKLSDSRLYEFRRQRRERRAGRPDSWI